MELIANINLDSQIKEGSDLFERVSLQAKDKLARDLAEKLEFKVIRERIDNSLRLDCRFALLNETELDATLSRLRKLSRENPHLEGDLFGIIDMITGAK